jgi:hypothetical protein
MKAYRGTSWKLAVCFTPRLLYPVTHWIAGRVSPRAGLDYVEKWKLLTVPGHELRPFCGQPVTNRYTDRATEAPHILWFFKSIKRIDISERYGKYSYSYGPNLILFWYIWIRTASVV